MLAGTTGATGTTGARTVAPKPAPAVAAPKPAVAPKPAPAAAPSVAQEGLKSAVLAAIREGNKMLYSMVVAQAQKVEVDGDSIVFAFAPAHRSLRSQLESKRAWIESLAQAIAKRRISVVVKDGDPAPTSAAPTADAAARDAKAASLRARAKAEPTVQAVLDVFGGEIDQVDEIE
jgi:hypothetical protein